MLACGHTDQPGTHGLCGAWLSKLPYALWECKYDNCENFNWSLWYHDLTLPHDQGEVWVNVG